MDSIKTRIAHLLATATSDNENEAAVAMAMAQRLMDKHNLSIAELGVEEAEGLEEQVIKDGESLFAAGRISSWKDNLANYLATANSCRIIKWSHQGYTRGGERGSKLVIYGRPSDIAMVRFMLAYAITQLSRFAPKGMGKVYSNSWYLGAVRGINQKLTAAKKETYKAASPFALVKLETRTEAVDKFIEVDCPRLRSAAKTTHNIHAGAYNQGFERGKSMDLNEKGRLKAASAIGVK